MLLYNFNNQIIDLSTFIKIDNTSNYDLLLNPAYNQYTYEDLSNYLNGSYNLKDEFETIREFNNSPFFRIYNKVRDLNLFRELFEDIFPSLELIRAYKASEKIRNEIFRNESIKSFYKYNLEFRNNTLKFDNNFLINWNNKEFFNWKENYSTFRITNSFVTLPNSEIRQYIKSDKKIFELDVKASDLLFILFLSFFQNKNKELLNKIYKYGVYNIVKSLEAKEYQDRKLELLISLYSITKNTILSTEQKNIIKELNLDYLVDYLLNNEYVYLCNGIKRKNEHPIAIYGQSATSIFIRLVINSLKKYLYENNLGKILYSKFDSIIFEFNGKIVDNNKFFVYIKDMNFNFCGKDYLITEEMEKLFNIVFKKNYIIRELK